MMIDTNRMRAATVRIALVSFVSAGLAGPMSVDVIASPVKWTCNCIASGPNKTDTCKCKNRSYDLPKSGTKTFRATCKGWVDGAPSMRLSPSFVDVMRGKNVTCTISSNFNWGFVSKQCTNWGTSNRNKVTMSIQCRGPD